MFRSPTLAVAHFRRTLDETIFFLHIFWMSLSFLSFNWSVANVPGSRSRTSRAQAARDRNYVQILQQEKEIGDVSFSPLGFLGERLGLLAVVRQSSVGTAHTCSGERSTIQHRPRTEQRGVMQRLLHLRQQNHSTKCRSSRFCPPFLLAGTQKDRVPLFLTLTHAVRKTGRIFDSAVSVLGGQWSKKGQSQLRWTG